MGIAPAGPATGNLITVANPAAGSNFQYTVPANTSLHLVLACYSFTASGAAANRYCMLGIDDGAVPFCWSYSYTKLVASESAHFTFTHSYVDNAGPPIAFRLCPLPQFLLLPAGYRINSSIVDIDAADQVSGIRLLVKRYIA